MHWTLGQLYDGDVSFNIFLTFLYWFGRYIRSKNRQNLKYKLAPNSFTDMTEEEVNLHRGLLHDKNEHKAPKQPEVLKFNHSVLSLGLIPDDLDWRDYGNEK